MEEESFRSSYVCSGTALRSRACQLARKLQRKNEISGIRYHILPALLLQKPSAKSKLAEHKTLLEKRLDMWEKGEIQELLQSGRSIQKRLIASQKKGKEEDTARKFSNLMFEGKVNAAVRMVCEEADKGVLPLNKDTLDQLKKKHPSPAGIMEKTLLFGPVGKIYPQYFHAIDGGMIFRAAKMTNGGAGPSGTDSDFFQHIIMNKNFKGDGEKLRTELAKYARQICSEYLHPALIMPYLNSRLIPLNKCPGIRPIGIGETVRRIVGKAVAWTMKQDIQGVAGPLQVCTGLKSGAEATVHFIREKFREETAQACILVDASNAFNSVNRQVMLHNIQRQLPELAPVAINMYRNESRLFVSGTAITSSEGTTQGDNLAMSLFALATLPILQHLERLTIAWQVWLADDATAVGTLARLQHWWRLIVEEGKKYGYHVNATKSCLVLKNSEDLSVAQELFGPSGIRISSEGQRHLGSVIGSADFTASYIEGLVNEWESMINNLSVFARTQPHAAYCAFTHGVRHKVTYFMRIENYRWSWEISTTH